MAAGEGAMRSPNGGGGGGSVDAPSRGGGGMGVTSTGGAGGKGAKYKALGAVVAWFTSTVVLISCNKVLMLQGGFRLPIFLTFLHMIVSYAWCEFSAEMRVGIKNLAEAGKIFFLSQTLALCVVLSVASFKYVEVSLEQALSASTPAFTALLGVLILGKREKWRVWLTLLPVVGGAMVSAGGEPTLHVLGVTLIFLSNIMRATKSCMQELLLGRDAMDSLNLLRWMSVFSMTTLLPLSFILEGPTVIHERLTKVYRDEKLLLALLANCCGAFMTNLTQFMVTEHVGALSMQVLGNLKNVFTAGVSVFIFHNEVTAQGLVGYTITMLGAVVYHREKSKHHAGGDTGKAAAGGPSAPAPAMSGGAGGEGGGVSRLRSNIP